MAFPLRPSEVFGSKPSGSSRRPDYLFIDVQHGLCNRLRALASAAVIGERTGRQVVVVWRPDDHCEARMEDLFHSPFPVLDDGVSARRLAARSYNYMEIEPGSVFQEPVEIAETDGDVYIRSAYTLTSSLTDQPAENRFLRRLVPVQPVTALVARVSEPFDIALHVRMATGPAFDHIPAESPANWPAHRHTELSEWRQKSHVSHFIPRIETLLVDRPDARIFVAADLPAGYETLRSKFGHRVSALSRDCYDRSARQLQYALADLILLSRSAHFLASTWSSFSDVAQRIAPPGRPVERSGLDF